MAGNKESETLQNMRDVAVQKIDNARAAYSQFMDAAHKEMVKTVAPSSRTGPGMTEVQEKAMKFTQQNLDAAFSLATELAKAKDFQEAVQIQARHAQLQMHAYGLQAQELGGLANSEGQKGK